jgi:hypothetical protein
MYYHIGTDRKITEFKTQKKLFNYLLLHTGTINCAMIFKGKHFYASRFSSFKLRKLKDD